MWFPDDIWNYLKAFVFKTEEMKVYDIFVKHFDKIYILSKSLHFDNYEKYIYMRWKDTKKISFIEKHYMS
jgi:hypothetical protein